MTAPRRNPPGGRRRPGWSLGTGVVLPLVLGLAVLAWGLYGYAGIRAFEARRPGGIPVLGGWLARYLYARLGALGTILPHVAIALGLGATAARRALRLAREGPEPESQVAFAISSHPRP